MPPLIPFLLFSCLLIAQPWPFSAEIVDREGRPLGDGVWISPGSSIFITRPDGTRSYRPQPVNGKIDAWTTSPRIIFRKYGFQSVVAKPELGLRITMDPAPSAPFPLCRAAPAEYDRIFHFPEAPLGDGFQDIDYSGRSYPVNTRTGKHYLQHGSGPSWSYGVPLDDDQAQSVTYEEQTWLFDKFQIAHARGTLPNGAVWRFLGKLGETAAYKTNDPEAARQLDRFLDSVCLAKPPRPK